MSIGRMMAGGAAKGAPSERRADDYYQTPRDVTAALLLAERGQIRHHLQRAGEVVWEPACGDGALAKVLIADGLPVIGTDLVDRGYGQGGVDFLKLGRSKARSSVIITNPPFFLAADFIVQARRLGCVYLALLLKSTYWHAVSRLHMWREWPPAVIYPLTWRPDFTGQKGPTMDVMWCVWHSGRPIETHYSPLSRPPDKGLF